MQRIISGLYAFFDWAENELSHMEDHANDNYWLTTKITSTPSMLSEAHEILERLS